MVNELTLYRTLLGALHFSSSPAHTLTFLPVELHIFMIDFQFFWGFKRKQQAKNQDEKRAE